MKANLLKKITLKTLITMNIEEKRNLGLKSTVGEVEIDLLNNEKTFRDLGSGFVVKW